jgi:hypothetical protein
VCCVDVDVSVRRVRFFIPIMSFVWPYQVKLDVSRGSIKEQ